MKRTVGLILGLVFSLSAYAGFEAYNGTTSLSIFDKLVCSTGLTCTRSLGKLVMTATASGVLQSQVATTTATITSAQCGRTFVSDSADVMTLPEASTVLGCRLTFVCNFAGNLDVNPNDATDLIGTVVSVTGANTTTVLAPAAGDAIRCGAVGASIMLEAVGANQWISVGASNGTWTDVN